jgi:hypothetical protein
MQGMREMCKINGVLQVALPMEAIRFLLIKVSRMGHNTMTETIAQIIIMIMVDMEEVVEEVGIEKKATGDKNMDTKMILKAPILTLIKAMMVVSGKNGDRHLVNTTMVQNTTIIMVVAIIAMRAIATRGTMTPVRATTILQTGTMIESVPMMEEMIGTMIEEGKSLVTLTATNAIRGKREFICIFYILTCQMIKVKQQLMAVHNKLTKTLTLAATKVIVSTKLPLMK